MSDFVVLDDDMENRWLSDTQIEAMIEGVPVEGAPEQLAGLIASLRESAAAAPTVAVSGALREFIVDGASTTAAESDTSTEIAGATARPIRRVAKAASVLGVVPAYLVVGATMAAAAVGGAHVLGVVDVPLLPARERSVVAPVSTVAEAPGAELPNLTPLSTAPSTTPHEPGDDPASTSSPTRPPLTDPAVPRIPGLLDRGIVAPTLPTPAPVDADAGCEFAQDIATDRFQHAPVPTTTDTEAQGDSCDRPVTTPAPPSSATPVTPKPATPSAPTTPNPTALPTPRPPTPNVSTPNAPTSPTNPNPNPPTSAPPPSTSAPMNGGRGNDHDSATPSPDVAPAGELDGPPTPPSENLEIGRTADGR